MVGGATDVSGSLLKKAVGFDHRKLTVRDNRSRRADLPELHHGDLDEVRQFLSSGSPYVVLAVQCTHVISHPS